MYFFVFLRHPGGRPTEPVKKEKKPLFGKKKAPAKDAPRDKWAGFQDAWEDDPDEVKAREARKGGKKPGYKDGKRTGEDGLRRVVLFLA